MRLTPKKPTKQKKYTIDDDLLWAYITKEHLQDLEKLNDPSNELTYLAELFGYQQWNSELYQCILVSFYHNIYM